MKRKRNNRLRQISRPAQDKYISHETIVNLKYINKQFGQALLQYFSVVLKIHYFIVLFVCF